MNAVHFFVFLLFGTTSNLKFYNALKLYFSFFGGRSTVII